jgi:hypothetical protein
MKSAVCGTYFFFIFFLNLNFYYCIIIIFFFLGTVLGTCFCAEFTIGKSVFDGATIFVSYCYHDLAVSAPGRGTARAINIIKNMFKFQN